MRKAIYCLLLIMFKGSCFAQDTTNAFLIKYYSSKVQNYLDKEKALSGFYDIDKEGIRIYENALSKRNSVCEFCIEWKHLDNFKKALTSGPSEKIFAQFNNGKYVPVLKSNPVPEVNTSSLKLNGIRIALDPGHTAHNIEIGDLEKKYLKFKKDSLAGLPDSIEIAEGVLTFATAQLLKEKLKAQGAEVFITRSNGTSAFGKSYYEWKQQDLKKTVDSLFKIGEISLSQKQYFTGPKAKDNDIFRVIFRDLELAQRAELINNFKPDLTVIIHFNVDETNTGWKKPGCKNFNMTFIGGAFMKNDLSSKEKRFEFLRLLATDDLEKSILLSSEMIKSFEKNLNVKTAKMNEARYLTEGCLQTNENGVYCRNLQLTRYIHSPLVYGETLCQDDLTEATRLNKEKDKTKNERIKQVAEAYYIGIMNYISGLK
jgi:N-acetylmuramoyl-L-alanine amidase